jgi:hypothetical protein
LREAGAIIFTKTTMPDYGMLSSGLSSFHPLTRNPWDLTRNPGGSSAGAGALAAACCGPLHLGTDIGGSVRLPAGWCGISALKPSGGRVPIDPPYIGRVAGPMTRNVADAALMMATLAQPDARDFMSLPPQRLDWRVAPAKLAGLRIGVLLEAGCFATLPSTLEAAPSPALAERSGAPSGLRPSTFVMSDTPVEVQFTSAGCLNYPCRTPFSDRQLPAHHRRRRARRRSADTRCPKAAINSGILAYDRTFDLFGQTGSVAIVLPYFQGNLSGNVGGDGKQITRQGFGDLAFRFTENLIGSPALTPAEFARREPTTTLGVSMTVELGVQMPNPTGKGLKPNKPGRRGGRQV